jgi:membrane-bound metal-dependent hydrolase YbcI (DUF457 family)
MLPKWHALFGAVFVLLLVFIFKINMFQAALVFLSSIFIDIDHYFYYLVKKKGLNLKTAYKFFIESEKRWLSLPLEKREEYKRIIVIFHGIEFLLLITILSFLFPIIFWVFLGVLVHILVDLFEIHFFYNEPLYSKLSQVYVYITNKNKREFKQI